MPLAYWFSRAKTGYLAAGLRPARCDVMLNASAALTVRSRAAATARVVPPSGAYSPSSRGTGPAAKPRFGGSPHIPWRPWRLGGSKSSSHLRGESSPSFTLVEMFYNDGSVQWEGPSGPHCNYFDDGSLFFWE